MYSISISCHFLAGDVRSYVSRVVADDITNPAWMMPQLRNPKGSSANDVGQEATDWTTDIPHYAIQQSGMVPLSSMFRRIQVCSYQVS